VEAAFLTMAGEIKNRMVNTPAAKGGPGAPRQTLKLDGQTVNQKNSGCGC